MHTQRYTRRNRLLLLHPTRCIHAHLHTHAHTLTHAQRLLRGTSTCVRYRIHSLLLLRDFVRSVPPPGWPTLLTFTRWVTFIAHLHIWIINIIRSRPPVAIFRSEVNAFRRCPLKYIHTTATAAHTIYTIAYGITVIIIIIIITTTVTIVITNTTQISADDLRTSWDGICHAVTVYRRMSDGKILLYYPVRVA